jgi:hypothetical protein
MVIILRLRRSSRGPGCTTKSGKPAPPSRAWVRAGLVRVPQSLGYVELPIPTAHLAFNHLAIGDLATVAS